MAACMMTCPIGSGRDMTHSKLVPCFHGLRRTGSRMEASAWASSTRVSFGLGGGFIGAESIKYHPSRGIGVIRAAWTRRSRGELALKPNKKSWGQRTEMYMKPFLLNVFFSKRYVHAKVVHRGTSKVISVASTNAKDLRNTLPSLTDNDACRTIGRLIAERSKEADVFAISYNAKLNERIEGKLGIILDTIKENGIIFV